MDDKYLKMYENIEKGNVAKIPDFSGKNISVNMLSPTSIKNKESKQFQNLFSEKTPIRRMSNLDEYSGPLIFLCSDSSSYLNGFNLLVDGGLTSI
jgi:NAD(P)-dependent dehydrogenase (short-subunit alcohol dehydrogenase family)